MRKHAELTLKNLTPDQAHMILVEGNQRFVNNRKENRNHMAQVLETSAGQYPFAIILSCIDSRVPAELVFDQGIGDVFSVRVAGNIINEDVLGSMEYACKVVGSKIVVVMGHTNCGAVTSACNNVKLGNVTSLLGKIQPSVRNVIHGHEEISDEVVDEVAKDNVLHSIEQIRDRSPILAELEANGDIEIVGAMYSVNTGAVEFFDK